MPPTPKPEKPRRSSDETGRTMERVIRVLEALRDIAAQAEDLARYRALVAEAARRGDLDLITVDLDKTAADVAAFIEES